MGSCVSVKMSTLPPQSQIATPPFHIGRLAWYDIVASRYKEPKQLCRKNRPPRERPPIWFWGGLAVMFIVFLFAMDIARNGGFSGDDRRLRRMPDTPAPTLTATFVMTPGVTAKDYLEEGRTHFNQGDFEAALHSYERAVLADPQNATTYFWRGRAYFELNDPTRAMLDFDTALTLDAEYADALGYRCSALSWLGRYEEAIPDCSQAVELEPDEEWYWYLRGNAYSQLDQYQDALSDYSKALRFV